MKKLFFLFVFSALIGLASYGAYFYDNVGKNCAGWNQWGSGSRSETKSAYLSRGSVWLWTEVTRPVAGTAEAATSLLFNGQLKVSLEQRERNLPELRGYYNFGPGTYQVFWSTSVNSASNAVSAAVGLNSYEDIYFPGWQ